MTPVRPLKSAAVKIPTRRNALKGAGAAVCLIGTPIGSTAAWAFDKQGKGSLMHLNALITALRETGIETCLNEASRLSKAMPLKSDFNLHLRRADLSLNDALNISEAIGLLQNAAPDTTSEQQERSMKSFSISYNPNVQNAGVVAFTQNFPESLKEIGMVGCALGDESGEALLHWAQQAKALQMMCIEGNNFSSDMRQRLARLNSERSGLLVIV